MEINYTKGLGLNLDDLENNRSDKGSVSFALNCVVTSTMLEGEYAYQTEEGTKKYLNFKDGQKPIGAFYLPQIDKTIYFLNTNEIGIEQNKTYSTLVSGECLNFNEDFPIHNVAVKVSNRSVQVFWTDDYNTMRFIDLGDLPFVSVPNPDNEYQQIKIEGELDCNKLKVFPNFSLPEITSKEIIEGGNVKEGVYQFGVAYSNDKSNLITSIYNISNPIHVNERQRADQVFDGETGKAIKIEVDNLDNSGIYNYFTVIVVETLNAISTAKILGTYPISNKSYQITYSGNTGTNMIVPEEELFRKFPVYKYAKGVTVSDSNLIWYGMRENRKLNYQQIWNNVKTNWVTHQLPYNSEDEGYGNPENAYKYKSFMRDEVYPLEGVFILTEGRETEAFHIPGRPHTTHDIEMVENDDIVSEDSGRCEDEQTIQVRWKVYNTAKVEQTDPDYIDDGCYSGVYQRGSFSYVESEERYPANQDIWGDLAGKPIRHHKFPDELISPRFKKIGDNTFIYPIGVEIDRNSLLNAIDNSDLTKEEKENIIGFKILRGDRSGGNMSVLAKGSLYNVGKYKNYDGEERYFPNYPYNSLDSDPLFVEQEVKPMSGYSPTKALKPFKGEQGKDQFTFHSPDTHFGRVSSVDTGFLKLEAIDYGDGEGEVVNIKDNAQYKFLTQNTQKYSLALATSIALEYDGKKAIPKFNGTDFAQVYNNMNTLFEKLVPFNNFGRNINSIAYFDKSIPIENNGFKQRRIDFGAYLSDGFNTIEEGKSLNNTRRESSVYIKTSKPLKFPTEYSPEVPVDLSRFINSAKGAREDITLKEFFELGTIGHVDVEGQTKESMNLAFFQSFLLGAIEAGEELGDNVNDSSYLTQLITAISFQLISELSFEEYLDLAKEEQACWDDNFPVRTINLQTGGEVVFSHMSFEVNSRWFSGDETDIIDPSLTRIANVLPNSITNNQIIHYNSAIDYIEIEGFQQDLISSLLPDGLSGYTLLSQQMWLAFALYGIRTGYYPIDLGQHNWYLNEQRSICGGVVLSACYKALEYGRVYYLTHFQQPSEDFGDNKKRFKVNNYYGSIKRNNPVQWGRLYSYETVDTGVVNYLNQKKFKSIFGGDTFINRFSIKRKQQVFNRSTVNEHDGMDIALDEEGALGKPMFWISTKPVEMNLTIDEDALSTSFSGIGARAKNLVTSSAMDLAGNVLLSVGASILGGSVFAGAAMPVVAIVGLAVTVVGAVVRIVSSIVRNKSTEIEKATVRLLRDLVDQLVNKLGIKNVNLDGMNRVTDNIKILGEYYHYVYGIPTAIVESQVNVSERKAFDEDGGNFYPRVTSYNKGIPSDWLQESRVPIVFDNTYYYNKSFSKQNREAFYGHLREDFDKDDETHYKFLNRAIYGEKEGMQEEEFNGWRVYKPLNYFDFPKEFGELTSVDGLGSKQVLVRFESNSQIYNAQSQLNVQGLSVYLGDPEMFSRTPPMDLGEGSQHRMLIETPYGYVYVNAKAGKVLLVGGRQPQALSDLKVRRWFQKYLPFDSREDNHYKGVTGLHGVFDPVHNRILLTKIEKGNTWTLSFSFLSKRWISWHSYNPNYYLKEPTHIRMGKGGKEEKQEDLGIFRTYFNEIFPQIVEFPFIGKSPTSDIVQSVEDYSVVEKFDDAGDAWQEEDIEYFNKAIVYNNQQTSGILHLIPRDENDLSQYFNFPLEVGNTTKILLDKRDEGYRFNQFYDRSTLKNKKIIKNQNKPVAEEIEFEEEFQENLNHERPPIRSRNSRVRLILDNDKNNLKITTDIITEVNTKSDI